MLCWDIPKAEEALDSLRFSTYIYRVNLDGYWKFRDLTCKESELCLNPPPLLPFLCGACKSKAAKLCMSTGEGLPTTTGCREDRVQNFNGPLFNVIKHFFGNENKT